VHQIYYHVHSYELLSFLHENTVTEELPDNENFKEEFFALTNYEENLPKDRYEGLLNSEDFLKHLRVLEHIKNAVNEDFMTLPKNQTCLNHTNLSTSRIIYRDKFIKFLNFQYAQNIDCFWDIALTIYYLGLNNNPKIEKDFILQYLHSHDRLDMAEASFLETLSIYKSAACKLILIKLLCSFFYEGIIFGKDRPSKFVEIIKTYENIRGDLLLSKSDISRFGVTKVTDEIFDIYSR